MTYTQTGKNATLKYMREKVKVINVRYRKEDYEQSVAPAIARSGLPAATFIKKAVEEKIERDHLNQ